MKSKIFDITPTISPRIGVFPGDTPFSRDVALDYDKGHHLRLSAIKTTLHVGAHADAPSHYSKEGVSIEHRDPALYLGKCLVVHAKCMRGERISKKNFSSLKFFGSERILVKTESFPNPDSWNSDFCSFDPEFIRELAYHGTRLIGIDTPSIDPEDSKALESHGVVAEHNLAILEGLVLDAVPEGTYTLIALPLKIEGADAAPVRAVLIDDGGNSL